MTKTHFCKARSCANLVLTKHEHWLLWQGIVWGRCSGPSLPPADSPFSRCLSPKPAYRRAIVVPREDYLIPSHRLMLFPPSPCYGSRSLCKSSGFHYWQQRARTPGRWAWPLRCTLTAIPGHAENRTRCSHRGKVWEKGLRQSTRLLLPIHGRLLRALPSILGERLPRKTPPALRTHGAHGCAAHMSLGLLMDADTRSPVPTWATLHMHGCTSTSTAGFSMHNEHPGVGVA